MTTPSRTSRPCVSVPTELLEAYRAAGARVLPLSTLLQNAMRTTLDAVDAEVPPRPEPARTAAATRARWPAHAHELRTLAHRAASRGCHKVSSDLRTLTTSSPANAASWLRAKLALVWRRHARTDASVQDHTIPKMASVSERLYREALAVVEPYEERPAADAPRHTPECRLWAVGREDGTGETGWHCVPGCPVPPEPPTVLHSSECQPACAPPRGLPSTTPGGCPP